MAKKETVKKTSAKKPSKVAAKTAPAKKAVIAKKIVPAKVAPAKKNAETKTKKTPAKVAPVKKTVPTKKAAETKSAKPAPKKVAKPAPQKVAKPAPKVAKPMPPKVVKPAPQKIIPKAEVKQPAPPKPIKKPVGIESLLLVDGAKFTKTPFLFDTYEKDDKESRRKHGIVQKNTEKSTAVSRPRIGDVGEGMNLIALLSQQLKDENRNFFSGCEGKFCDRCNNNEVDPKFYVNESLGYCLECATILGLGQSKEGAFTDAQIELITRAIESAPSGDINEDNVETVLEEFDDEEAKSLIIDAKNVD
ncbi:hypothetical protein AGMMS49938_08450 [Fibrobacterales bacterium]|nr:hypothetical protein AGMMS49938_08450 [Fibrobacterales bacterium]